MAIVVQYCNRLVIASRRTKLPNGKYYYARGSVTLDVDKNISTEHTCLDCNVIDSLTTYIVDTVKTEKHTICTLAGTNPKYARSPVYIELPKDLGKKQVQQIQQFLDTYFNNK